MRNTIKTQLFFIALTPLFLIIAFASAFILFESIDSVEDELNKRGKDITSQASLMSEFYFYTGDVDKLEEVAEFLKAINGLASIRFIDGSGTLLVERDYLKNDIEIKNYSTPVHSKSVQLDDFNVGDNTNLPLEALGHIEIALSRSSVTEKQKEIYYRGLAITLLSLVIGIVLTYLFSRKFSLAMTSLLDTATEIEHGNFDRRCQENGSGELLSFQKNFNEMIGSLQANEQELKLKIEESTSALNYTVEELSKKNCELEKTKQEAIELERSKAIADERTRIMKDMHDGVGGQLVASLALLELEKESTGKNNISNILADCLDDFRLIINSLDVHSNTLTALLADFKYRMNKKLDNINITLLWHVADLADGITIQPQQSLHILRILQESFTNILKHANANKINFEAIVQNNKIILVIEDHGDFSPSNDNNYGNGITNMIWRANELGGEFNICRGEFNGCRIVLSIPC
ncbi:MAG: hypothetical protein K6L75_03920 [Cellvibrionaceae bacterium]